MGCSQQLSEAMFDGDPQTMKSLAISAGTVAAILAAIISPLGLWWTYGVRQDRRHTIIVRENTVVFAGAGNDNCEGSQLTVITPGSKPKVRRIRYWKTCATIDVSLADGSVGHILYEGRNVAVAPELP